MFTAEGGNSKPNTNIIRADFVSMLARALGLSAKPEAATMLYRLIAER